MQMPKPNGMHRVSNEDDDSASQVSPQMLFKYIFDVRFQEMAEPIFAKNRYGREDILALIPKDSKAPPAGLQQCPYFTVNPQPPIILTNLNETEQVPPFFCSPVFNTFPQL